MTNKSQISLVNQKNLTTPLPHTSLATMLTNRPTMRTELREITM